MRRAARMAASAALAVLVAGCLGVTDKPGDPLRPPGGAAAKPKGKKLATSSGPVPHVYMTLQPDKDGPLSIIFAIDRAKDGSPNDDPAIRLTPEDGKCNPQNLRSYDFPAEARAEPTFGPKQVIAGVTARNLPRYMAIAVTSEMLRRKMIKHPNESKPQNVCTWKLWERLILRESRKTG